MKIFSKKWWTDVPICKECKGTGESDSSIRVYWRGVLVKACKKCRGRGVGAI